MHEGRGTPVSGTKTCIPRWIPIAPLKAYADIIPIMDVHSNAIRELSDEECESTAGGLWLAVAILVGAAAAGSLLAYCTAPKGEEILIPDIQFPS